MVPQAVKPIDHEFELGAAGNPVHGRDEEQRLRRHDLFVDLRHAAEICARHVVGKFCNMKKRLASGRSESDNDDSLWTGEWEVATPFSRSPYPPLLLPIQEIGRKNNP